MKIKMKILIPMFLLNLLVVGAMGTLIYQRVSEDFLELGRNEALTMAQVSSSAIDGEKLQGLQPGQENSEAYQSILTSLNEIKDGSDILYLTTIGEIDGQICYVMDTDDSEGKCMIGDAFEYDAAIYERALEGSYAEDAIVVADYGTVITAYAPVYNAQNQVVGVVVSDFDASGIKESLNQLIFITIVFSIVAVIVSSVIMSIVLRTILKALNNINDKVHEMANDNGNLTQTIEIDSKDETGVIAENMNHFIQYIRKIIVHISNSTQALSESSGWITEHSNQIMDDVTDVSGIMEEMSAGMEETSASIIQVGDLVSDIQQSFLEMDANAKESAEYTHEITGKANELREGALETKKEVLSMAGEMELIMNEKIEESKAVQRIEELTDDILSISNQTNMLALNASIEAARAGESGKGFAVVAQRITELAASTASTATQIQEISRVVIEKVNELAVASGEMIQFLNDKTASGYDQLVKTSNDYQNDSKVIFDMMQDFAVQFEMLTEKVRYIDEAVADISKASEENALGITSVSETTSDIMSSLGEIREKISENQEIVKVLEREQSRFII